MNKKDMCVSVTIFLLSAVLFSCARSEQADLVLQNGKIFTVDDSNPLVESVAVKDGKILSLGSNNRIRKLIGPKTLVLDAKGKFVQPGFIDAHCHFVDGGKSLISLTFRGVNSIEKVQEMIAAKIKEIPAGAPVLGGEFDQMLFPGGNWPAKEDLDMVSPNNPVVIQRIDGHSVWVNSLALKISGINKNTKNPFGGEIRKDSKTGEPTGILSEAAAELVNIKGQESPGTLEDDILRALSHAAKLGVTSIQTASSLKEIEIYKKLDRIGKLTLRVYAWLPIEDMDALIQHGIRQGQGNDMVKVGFLKCFIDGTLGSGTALLFEPFSDDPAKSGLPQYSENAFNQLIEKAHEHDFQVGIHAIGDKGIHWVLNAVERAQQKYGPKNLRHRIEHASVISPGDVPRFGTLGVIASVQPTFCTSDISLCERRLGPERSKNAYLWRTLLDAGARLAFGTDWPVEPLDPMRGLYSAVTRRNIELGYPEGGWFPEQILSIAEAIGCYTEGSAFASYDENIKGSLKVGKYADMVILSRNLLECEPAEILMTEVLSAILGGKVVYQKGI